MRRGRIEQVGAPEELRDAPASAYVERFVAHQLAAPEPA
jgi:ABC-type proline/glycine betaine transport system ATPase subunit